MFCGVCGASLNVDPTPPPPPPPPSQQQQQQHPPWIHPPPCPPGFVFGPSGPGVGAGIAWGERNVQEVSGRLARARVEDDDK